MNMATMLIVLIKIEPYKLDSLSAICWPISTTAWPSVPSDRSLKREFAVSRQRCQYVPETRFTHGIQIADVRIAASVRVC